MTEKSWPRHHIPAARVLGNDGAVAHLHRFGERMEREIKDLKVNAEAVAEFGMHTAAAARTRDLAALILHEALAMTFFEIRQAERTLGVKPNGEVSAWQLEREALQHLGERHAADRQRWQERVDVVVADNAALLALLREVDGAMDGGTPCRWCGSLGHAAGCRLAALLDAKHPGKEILDRLGALEFDVESLNEDVDLATRTRAARITDLEGALSIVKTQRDLGWQLLDAIGEDFELATDPTTDSNKSAAAKHRIDQALRGRPAESSRIGLLEASLRNAATRLRTLAASTSQEASIGIFLDGVVALLGDVEEPVEAIAAAEASAARVGDVINRIEKGVVVSTFIVPDTNKEPS